MFGIIELLDVAISRRNEELQIYLRGQVLQDSKKDDVIQWHAAELSRQYLQ